MAELLSSSIVLTQTGNSLSDGTDDMVFSSPQQGHGSFPTESR
jgi:hypothetical protein